MRYFQATNNELARDIRCKLAQSMGLVSEHLFKEWPCQYRLNKYQFTPQNCGIKWCMNPDSGFLTILQDDASVGESGSDEQKV